jgi:putative spermidine/putrescine transport system substrate-binding protein
MSDQIDTKKPDAVASGEPAAADGGINTGRRALLKGAVATAGVAGAQAITGFPLIWSQEIKNIEIRHVGVSYSVVKAIGDQASKDLGFKVTMQNLDTSAAINRFVTQPATVDIADVEGWQAKLATKRGVLQGIERKKIKEFENILPIFTKGAIDGKVVSRQGISPYEAMYISKRTPRSCTRA